MTIDGFHIDVHETIRLTAFQPGDQADCVRWLNDQEIYQQTLQIPSPYTRSDFAAWLTIARREVGVHGLPVHWAIRLDKALVGGIGFKNLIQGTQAELGYWLAKPYRGRGLMSIVVQHACAYAFEVWQLEKITANVFVSNQASARVLAKNGFVRKEFLPMHCVKDDAPIAAWRHELTRDSWEQRCSTVIP